MRHLPVIALTLACTALADPAAAQPTPLEPATAAADAEQPAVTTEPGPIRKRLQVLARDLKAVPSRDSRAILIQGGIMALLAYPADGPATHAASSSPMLKVAFGTTGKLLGEEWVQGGTALATYVAGRLLDRPRLRDVGADLIEAQLFSATLVQPIKLAVRRTRPDGEARSFPSGHASASLATATVLHRHFGQRAAIPAYGAALYITMSRMQANSHYLSDLIAGAALGMVAGRAATIEVARTRLQIAPAPVPGGAAIVITASRP